MKALIISADLFEDSELNVPFHALLKAGLDIDIASIKRGYITGKHGLRLEAPLSLEEVDPKYYEILLLPGGKAPAALRKEPKALEIARYFFEHDKPVAAICHGPQILISAGLLKGREVTGYQSIKEELIEAGAIYKDEKVVVDGNLITSRTPSDLDEFVGAIKLCLRKLSG
jgi:PfpI family intracellular protease